MFPFITRCINPLGGKCPHECVYCWARDFAKRYNLKKYQSDVYQLYEKELKRVPKGSFIFVQDMNDIFGRIYLGHLYRIFEWIRDNPDSQFLLLTKNPIWYVEFIRMENVIPSNAVLGCTIESDIDYPEYSKAPKQSERLFWMKELRHEIGTGLIYSPHTTCPKIFISIEPILDFNLERFVKEIAMIEPWAVAVGYDNYGHRLKEPTLDLTRKLIRELRSFTRVYIKTLRKAWFEKYLETMKNEV